MHVHLSLPRRIASDCLLLAVTGDTWSPGADCGLLAAPVPTTPMEEDEGAQDGVSPFPWRSAKSPSNEESVPQQALHPCLPVAVLDYGMDVAGRMLHTGGQTGGDAVSLLHSGPETALKP